MNANVHQIHVYLSASFVVPAIIHPKSNDVINIIIISWCDNSINSCIISKMRVPRPSDGGVYDWFFPILTAFC